MKVNLETIQSIFLTIGVIAILVGVTAVILSQIAPSYPFDEKLQLTFDKCCGGNVCTDTYYDEEDGKCHSTFEMKGFISEWYITMPIVFGIAIVLVFVSWFVTRNYSSPAEPSQVMDDKSFGEPR